MSATARPIVDTPTPALRSLEALWRGRAPGPGTHAGTDGGGLASLRAEAMRRVLALGLPTSRDETWRQTNVRPLLARSFAEAPATAGEAWPQLLERATTVLTVNGRPDRVQRESTDEKAIFINRIDELSRTNPGAFPAPLALPSDADDTRWALVNTALFSDGWHIRIDGAVSAPLVIQHRLSSDTPNRIALPRVRIHLAPGASATVLEHFVAEGTHPPLANSVSEIAVGRGAQLEHYRVFSTSAAAEHIDSLTLRQDGDSRCRQFTVVVGGGWVRTGLHAHLDQAGAELDSHSLLVGHAERHVDCVNVAAHHARDTRSRQTSRAIASGASRVIFNTKVIVDPGAVQAQSEQSFRGLLLAPTAEIDSRPQLEIHTDEVKCAHGATTGRLDRDTLFYLLSRGLDRATAQTLLVYAFVGDVLTGMSLGAVRTALEAALVPQLPDSGTLEKFR